MMEEGLKTELRRRQSSGNYGGPSYANVNEPKCIGATAFPDDVLCALQPPHSEARWSCIPVVFPISRFRATDGRLVANVNRHVRTLSTARCCDYPLAICSARTPTLAEPPPPAGRERDNARRSRGAMANSEDIGSTMADKATFSACLTAFAKLSADDREKLVSALEEAKPAMTIDALAERVQGEAGVAFESLARFIEGIASLVPFATDDENFRSHVADMLHDILAEHSDSPQPPGVKEQLSRLLACELSVGVTGKAHAIMWGHGCTYEDAHVLTQIRPVFLNHLEKRTEHAVLAHELRLDYRRDGQLASVCVAMDRDKVEHLQSVLERAIQKENNLRNASAFDYLTRENK